MTYDGSVRVMVPVSVCIVYYVHERVAVRRLSTWISSASMSYHLMTIPIHHSPRSFPFLPTCSCCSLRNVMSLPP